MWPSPDGRWLVTLTQNGVDVYDAERIWHSPGPVANWVVEGTSVAWLPDGSFVVVERTRVVRLQVGEPDRMESTLVPVALTLATIPDLRG